MRGPWAGLPKKRLNKASRGAGSDWCRFGHPLLLGDVPFLDGSSNRVEASTDLEVH